MTLLIFEETFGVLKEIPDDESERITKDYIEKRLKKTSFTPNYFSALDDITSTAKFPASITLARVLVIVFLVLVGVFISSLTLDSDSTKHVIFYLSCCLNPTFCFSIQPYYFRLPASAELLLWWNWQLRRRRRAVTHQGRFLVSTSPELSYGDHGCSLLPARTRLYHRHSSEPVFRRSKDCKWFSVKSANGRYSAGQKLSSFRRGLLAGNLVQFYFLKVNSKKFPIFNFALSLYRLAKSVDPESADETFYALLWESYKQKRVTENPFDDVSLCSRSWNTISLLYF